MMWLVRGLLVPVIGSGGNTATVPVWHANAVRARSRERVVVKEMTGNVGGFVMSNAITLVFSGSSLERIDRWFASNPG
jgi:hypothetical protein